jgi:hypothetical protein
MQERLESYESINLKSFTADLLRKIQNSIQFRLQTRLEIGSGYNEHIF